MTWKSMLKPEASVTAGIATIIGVYGVYQLSIGPVALAQATDANHPAMATSRKKAGWMALTLVAGLTLITKDANVGILGGGTIIAMELAYRHGIMADPMTGKIQNPNPNTAYEPAENVIEFPLQGQTG